MKRTAPATVESTPQDGDAVPAIGPGRRRDPDAHAAILRATADLLREVGYAGLTIEGVARAAGVGKATIYRWWESKGLLVYEAVFSGTSASEAPDMGSLDADLRHVVRMLVAEFSSAEAVAATPGLLADFGSDEHLAVAIRERFLLPVRSRMATIFDRAVLRGELHAGVRPEVALNALAGAVFWQIVLAGQPAHPRLADDLVSLVIGGLAHGRGPEPFMDGDAMTTDLEGVM